MALTDERILLWAKLDYIFARSLLDVFRDASPLTRMKAFLGHCKAHSVAEN